MQPEQATTKTTAQFRASAGRDQGVGNTLGEALNDLLGRLGENVPTPIVIWPYNRSDQYFTDAQQERLLDLRSRMEQLTLAEREEWEHLVEASFDATITRSQAVQSSK